MLLAAIFWSFLRWETQTARSLTSANAPWTFYIGLMIFSALLWILFLSFYAILMAFLTASEHWACWTCHHSLWFYLLLFKEDKINTCLCSIKLLEWQTWIFKTTLNLLIYVLLRECFRLCPMICGVRFFWLSTVICSDWIWQNLSREKCCYPLNHKFAW